MTIHEYERYVREVEGQRGDQPVPRSAALAIAICCFVVALALAWWGLS